MCKHLIKIYDKGFHPGGTCLRVEVMTTDDRCALVKTKFAVEKNIDPFKWIASGGSPIDVYESCCCASGKEECHVSIAANIF